MTSNPFAELLSAGVVAGAAFATSAGSAVQSTGAAPGELERWIATALLGLVSILIAGAWNDLRRRDREIQERLQREEETGRQERARIFAVLDGHGRDIAVLLDRQERYVPSVKSTSEGL